MIAEIITKLIPYKKILVVGAMMIGCGITAYGAYNLGVLVQTSRQEDVIATLNSNYNKCSEDKFNAEQLAHNADIMARQQLGKIHEEEVERLRHELEIQVMVTKEYQDAEAAATARLNGQMGQIRILQQEQPDAKAFLATPIPESVRNGVRPPAKR